jgi:RNA polymerase primary sigma factor
VKFLARWFAPFAPVEVRPASTGHALEPARAGPNLATRPGVTRNLLPRRTQVRALGLAPFRRAQVRPVATIARVTAHLIEHFGDLFRFGPPRPPRVYRTRAESPPKAPEVPLLSVSELLDREIERHPQLSAEDTRELLTEYASLGPLVSRLDDDTGCERLRREIPEENKKRAHELMDELVLGHLRLCMHWVLHGRWADRSRSLSRDDYFQQAVLGLMNAIELFDPAKETELSTYAKHWIRQAVGRARYNQDRLVRIPVYVFQRRNLTADNYRQLSYLQPLPVGDEEPASREVEPLVALIGPETASCLPQDIETALLSLDHREADILRRRFGIGGQKRETLLQIGKGYGLTKERVRQIERDALLKLRDSPLQDLR